MAGKEKKRERGGTVEKRRARITQEWRENNKTRSREEREGRSGLHGREKEKR